MAYYAQLGKDNIVVSVSNLSAKVVSSSLIELATNDTLLLGMTYNNGTFIDTPIVEPLPEQPDRIDVLEQKVAEQDMVLEEIMFVIIPEMMGGGI